MRKKLGIFRSSLGNEMKCEALEFIESQLIIYKNNIHKYFENVRRPERWEGISIFAHTYKYIKEH